MTDPKSSDMDSGQKFAAYLAHELRAPLTSVHSALQILQGSMEDRMREDERKIFSLAVKNSVRLGGLINDILDYASIRAGKFKLDLRPRGVGALLREAVDGLDAWARLKGVALVLKPETAPLPPVFADARRTIQVLTNLLSNAIKFTPKGGRIEVSAEPGKNKDDGAVVVSVRDTGCGIPEREFDAIFERFARCAETETRQDGTGLGLTMAKSMVELQGGRIWVESRVGLGSVFRFTLPLSSPKDSRTAGLGLPQAQRTAPGLIRRLADAAVCAVTAILGVAGNVL